MIKSNLAMNQKFLSIALLDKPMRDIAMKLKIVQVEESAEVLLTEDIEFTWTVIQVTENEIQIEIMFDDPLMLSNDSEFQYHSV